MTRINLVKPEELATQHLVAEYRELPRIIKMVGSGKAKLDNIPPMFCLGKGHVKFFYDKIQFLRWRYFAIELELMVRGIKASYSGRMINEYIDSNQNFENLCNDWKPTLKDIELSKQRLREKYQQKPGFYKFRKTGVPKWYLSPEE